MPDHHTPCPPRHAGQRDTFPRRDPDEWADALGLKRSGSEYVGACPACGGNDRFHVRPGRDGGTAVGCRGCIDGQPDDVRRRAYREIVRRTWPGDGPRPAVTPARRPVRSKARGPSEAQRITYARTCWQASHHIPSDAAHPARRWLADRQLWWSGLPLPPAVRWLPRQPADDWPYEGRPEPRLSALVVLRARPAAWIDAWPNLPALESVQLIYVTAAGEPGRPTKPTYGRGRDTVAILGSSAPSDAGLRVCEGLADGLALASRHWQSVLLTFGRPPKSGAVLDYAAIWPGVTIHADRDKRGDGQLDAWRMRQALGDRARWVLPASGKDPADEARADPLPVFEGLRAEVGKLADKWEARGLPRWEALRRAALELNE